MFKTIQSKITISIFSCILACSVIIGSLCAFSTTKIAEDNANENMSLLCERYAYEINSSIEKAEDSVKTLNQFASEESFSIEEMKTPEGRALFSSKMEKNALHHIETVTGAEAIYLYYNPELGAENNGFAYLKQKNTNSFEKAPLETIVDITNEDQKNLWNSARENKSGCWLDLYYNTTVGKYVTSYVMPVYKENQFLGVIGLHLSTSFIEETIKGITLFDSSKLAVLDHKGTVIYHPTLEQNVSLFEKEPALKKILETSTEKDEKALLPYNLDGVDKLITSYQINNGMLVVCFVSADALYREVVVLNRFICIATCTILVLGIILSFSLARAFSKPIKKLNEAAKHLTDGEYDFSTLSRANDEVGELSQTLIESRKMIKHQIHLLNTEAHRDGLTGVNNKSALMEREVQINRKIASDQADFSVAVFDVNKLKITNDFFGHLAGDKMLSVVAEHLSTYFDSDHVFRIGGDEFLVIIPEEKNINSRKLISACANSMKKLSVEGFPDCGVSCAYGLVRFDPEIDSQFSDVVHRADKEMYKHKVETRKESSPWQASGKSLKQLQIEKYSSLLQNLTASTDDYLFLFDVQTGNLQFFGDATRSFTISDGQNLSAQVGEMLSFVHPNDHHVVEEAISSIISFETESIDIDFRLCNLTPGNPIVRWANCRGQILHDETNAPFVLSGRISKNAIKHLYNPLTTLFNKTKLKNDLRHNALPPFTCLMLVDIDNFSEIIIKNGSVFGDRILKSFAEELESRFEIWQIYHAEKDRFVILLNATSSKEATKIFEELKTTLSKKCSISASLVPNDRAMYINAENIFDYAVQLLNTARKDGNGQLIFFSKDSLMEQISAVEFLEELKESVNKKCEGFQLVYQPQIDADNYTICSAEALLRYNSPDKGLIYPNEFIPLLEQTDLICDVGLWVINEALSQCKAWKQYNPDFKVCVNLSPKQLKQNRLAAQISKCLSKYGLTGKDLILEITESAQIDEVEESQQLIMKLKQLGIQIAIDDFGTGYSNLGMLKHLEANILKVDRIFVQNIKENGYNYNLIHNIIEFAKGNDMKVCLEGVETSKEFICTAPLHPDLFQGYLFDKPMSPEALEEAYFQADSPSYKTREEKIEQLLREKSLSPVVKMETKTILRGMNVGLWTIRINTDSQKGELHANDTMLSLLGLDNRVSPEECYQHWRKGIHENYTAAVDNMVLDMAQTGQVHYVDYLWNHPERGEVKVRCSGRCAEKKDGILIFEGFHRLLNDSEADF